MSLFKRFLYYFGGFSIGLLILFFFLGGKKASCDYGPNARTLKNIRSKERIVSHEAMKILQKLHLDTATVSTLLNEGDVLFSESKTKRDSCKLYVIQGHIAKRSVKMTVENCTEKATIISLKVQD